MFSVHWRATLSESARLSLFGQAIPHRHPNWTLQNYFRRDGTKHTRVLAGMDLELLFNLFRYEIRPKTHPARHPTANAKPFFLTHPYRWRHQANADSNRCGKRRIQQNALCSVRRVDPWFPWNRIGRPRSIWSWSQGWREPHDRWAPRKTRHHSRAPSPDR